MPDLLEYLYQYAADHLFRPALAEDEEYETSCLAAGRYWSRLKETADVPQQRLPLQDYRDAAADKAAAEQKAMFCAGLRMGLSLGALHHS